MTGRAAAAFASSIALGLAGCALGQMGRPVSATAGEILAGAARPPAAIMQGRVVFPQRAVQATYDEIGMAATVAFINPDLNQTIATTRTDPRGMFLLSFGFIPQSGKAYVLEAVKGLQDNAVGSDAVRVRTFVRWFGGWQSIGTGGASTIVINTSTTAVATIASLRGTDSVNPSNLFGSIRFGVSNGDFPDTFTPGSTAISTPEFNLVYEYVAAALQEDKDPIDSVYFQTGTYKLKDGIGGALLGPSISYLTPLRAAEGDTVSIYGSNLVPAIGSTAVTFFPGVAAPVTVATRTALKVLVPSGAKTGDVTVTVGGKSAVAFISIIPSIGGGLKLQ
ncbi:MAG: hypothetical protein FJZ01_23965 [Candidatus Sericytochromatia bacterium]|nr:hypothetical protein [Candidatus Tanganyikabacteria bacterium]